MWLQPISYCSRSSTVRQHRSEARPGLHSRASSLFRRSCSSMDSRRLVRQHRHLRPLASRRPKAEAYRGAGGATSSRTARRYSPQRTKHLDCLSDLQGYGRSRRRAVHGSSAYLQPSSKASWDGSKPATQPRNLSGRCCPQTSSSRPKRSSLRKRLRASNVRSTTKRQSSR